MLGAHKNVDRWLRSAKDEFYDLLIRKDRLSYFDQPSADQSPQTLDAVPFLAISKFDRILERRLLVACALVNGLADDPHFGRTKLAKLLYLADATQDLGLHGSYYREAAGPLDARALYNEKIGIEPLGNRHNYFAVEDLGRRVRYKPGGNMKAALEIAPSVMGKKLESINRIIELCRPLDTDQCEIVATLYACWNDKLLDDEDASDEKIVDEFLAEWHKKKRRFSRRRLLKALTWMRGHQLQPLGRGGHTKLRRGSDPPLPAPG